MNTINTRYLFNIYVYKVILSLIVTQIFKKYVHFSNKFNFNSSQERDRTQNLLSKHKNCVRVYKISSKVSCKFY